MAMDWSDERWVRVYTRDTASWKMLGWQARTVFLHLLRKVDRAGVIDDGGEGDAGIAAALDLPLDEVVAPGLAQLVKRGTVAAAVGGYVIPNFLAAQEAPTSDAQRQRRSRETRRATAMQRTGDVTNRDRQSQNVTECHKPSRQVTTCHSETRLDETIRDPEISLTAGARATGEPEKPIPDSPPEAPAQPRPVDRMLPLAERLRVMVDTARSKLLTELGASFPPGERANDLALQSTTLAIVVGWCAASPDRDPATVVEERGRHLVAVRLATARARKSATWWAPSTFWDLDGIDKDLMHPTPAAAVAAIGSRDGPRRQGHQQPDPPRRPMERL